MSLPLLLHERALPDGALERIWLEVEAGALFFHVEGAFKTEVPIAVLDAVMKRYGRPLAEDVTLDGPRLELSGRALSVLRHRSRYDVIARDYLVYEVGEHAPVAELASAITGALAYLLRAGDSTQGR